MTAVTHESVGDAEVSRDAARRVSVVAAGGHVLWVDVLGCPRQIDGVALTWDVADSLPRLAAVGGSPVVTGPAGLVGTAAGWGGATARQTRSFAADPWAVPDWQTSDRADMSTPAQGGQAPGGQTPGGQTPGGQVFGGQVPGGRAGSLPAVGLPAGVSLSGAGSVVFSGMEWMGARVYDPATRGFLAVDPVPGVPGAGWQTNAYAYAGNNPVGISDPSGLAPLSDADLATWDNAHQGAIAAVGDWWNDNWEYVAAGAAIAVGVGLMFTGVGGPVGAVLIGAASGAFISGGISMAGQKATTGSIDWITVGRDALVGAVGGAAGAGAAQGLTSAARAGASSALMPNASSVARAGYGVVRNSAVRGATAQGLGNGVSNVADYATDPRITNRDVAGYAGSFLTGFGVGAAGSGLTNAFSGRASSYVSQALPQFAEDVSSAARRGIPLNWAGVASEQFIGHAGGSAQAVVNEYIRPEGTPQGANLWQVAVNGFVSGGTGPTVGIHAK